MNEHAPATTAEIPDVQGLSDARRIAIAQVGVRAIRHPIQVSTGDAPVSTVATVAMSVSLPHDRKGTHMSRFLDCCTARRSRSTPNGSPRCCGRSRSGWMPRAPA